MLCRGGFATCRCHICDPTAAQSCGSALHGRRNSCPCSWIHLFATGTDTDTDPCLFPSSAPFSNPALVSVNFFPVIQDIWAFPAPLASLPVELSLQPRVTLVASLTPLVPGQDGAAGVEGVPVTIPVPPQVPPEKSRILWNRDGFGTLKQSWDSQD